MPAGIEWVAVAVGGAAGAMMRHAATLGAARMLPGGFPWGTLLVNVTGSLLMGAVYVLLIERGLLPPVWRSFLAVGLLGAFTTFSAFSLDALALFEAGAPVRAAVYVVASVVVCILAAMAGIGLARTV